MSTTPPTLEQLTKFYRSMVRIRRFEETVADLVEAGGIKTPCHFCIGQEAAATGVCEALERDDYVWGAHRSHGHYLAKGGGLKELMAEIFCKASGCAGGRGGSMHIQAPEVGVMGTVPIVAATIPLAVGAGLAEKLRGSGRVSVAFFGDGATEEGQFHESLNLAALQKLPVIFVCENNLYSSHMGILERRPKDNLVEFGAVHGAEGIRVDGNDVTEVYRATVDCVARARSGQGPTLLECRTFRWRGHVGPAWDMDVGVKRKDELQEWLDRDPIARCEQLLMQDGVEPTVVEQIRHEVDEEVAAAVDFANRSPTPQPSDVSQHVFAA
jgi:pyruvate dehydrogenase E1 component alpha subunit